MFTRRARDIQRCLRNIESFTDNQARVVDCDYDELKSIKIELTPSSGPYKNGRFVFEIAMPLKYPEVPPDVSCSTNIYHPNIDPTGEELNVCLSLFDEWEATFGLEDTIQGLLFLFYEPNLEDPLSPYFSGESFDSFEDDVARSMRGETIDGVQFDVVVDMTKIKKQESGDVELIVTPVTADNNNHGNAEAGAAGTEDCTQTAGTLSEALDVVAIVMELVDKVVASEEPVTMETERNLKNEIHSAAEAGAMKEDGFCDNCDKTITVDGDKTDTVDAEEEKLVTMVTNTETNTDKTETVENENRNTDCEKDVVEPVVNTTTAAVNTDTAVTMITGETSDTDKPDVKMDCEWNETDEHVPCLWEDAVNIECQMNAAAESTPPGEVAPDPASTITSAQVHVNPVISADETAPEASTSTATNAQETPKPEVVEKPAAEEIPETVPRIEFDNLETILKRVEETFTNKAEDLDQKEEAEAKKEDCDDEDDDEDDDEEEEEKEDPFDEPPPLIDDWADPDVPTSSACACEPSNWGSIPAPPPPPPPPRIDALNRQNSKMEKFELIFEKIATENKGTQTDFSVFMLNNFGLQYLRPEDFIHTYLDPFLEFPLAIFTRMAFKALEN